MKKVLIPTKLDPAAREILFMHGGYEVVQDESSGLDVLAAAHPDCYALIVRSEKITQEVIDTLPALKVIIRAGAGYNTIDTLYARKKSIDVMNTPGANANAVAEEVVALMLADARHLIPADQSTRDGKWEKKQFMGREITGKTVGILGMGHIGTLVARRLSGFEVTVLGCDPMLSTDRALELGVELVDLPELFERSDYVSLHLPENDDTRGSINADLLGRMKPGATLVNCARAGVVNEDDLRALKKKHGLRFLNDVYAKDAEGPKSVADIADIMVPHLGASTREANLTAARRAAQQLVEFDDKGITSFIVNRDIPAGLDEAYAELTNTLGRLCRKLVGGRETTLNQIETSFYGSLQPFAEWLVVPLVVGLDENFDHSLDHQAARTYFKERGIDYLDREIDERKGYDNSITVDMTGGSDPTHLRQVSVRGTVAEGNLMVSRINDFNKLYFEPRGHTVVFEYEDRPGVLGRIAAALAEAGINIDDVRNPHDSKGTRSIAILKVNQAVPEDLLQSLRSEIEADSGFYLEL